MNSTVAHGISSTLFFVRKWGFYPFPGNSKFEKENSLSARSKTIREFKLEDSEFRLEDSEFSFSNLELPGKG